MKLSKKNQILILSLSVVVLVLIVLRVTNIFPSVDGNAAGTIGNVEKVDRFRGQQMKMEDIKCDNTEVAKFVQSAGFQNMMKDDNFRAILANPDQVKLLPFAVEVSQLVDQAAQNFHSFLEKGDNAKFFFGSVDYQQFYAAYGDAMRTIDPHFFPPFFPAHESNFIVPMAQDFQKFFFNSDFQKLVLNFDFKAVYNQDIQGIFGQEIVKFFGNDFQSIVPMNIDFNSSEFQKFIYMSQDFKKFYFGNQDFHKVFMNQDVQKMFFSQDFEKFVAGADFQNILKSGEFNKRM